jgi:hypothetical protein
VEPASFESQSAPCAASDSPGRAVLRFCDDEALLIDPRSRTIYRDAG